MLRILSTKRCYSHSSQFELSKLSHVLFQREESHSTNFLCRRSTALFSSKSSSWHSVYTYPPKRFPQVVAVPLMDRPLFPGFLTYANAVVQPEDMMGYNIGQHYFVGAFLLKDDPGTTIEAEKGKTLYDRLHKIGTIAMVRGWTSDEAQKIMLMGVGRIQITEMVNEDPLVVKVEHLENKRYNKMGDAIKATTCELITTMKDVLKRKSEMADQGQIFIEEMLEGNNLVFDNKDIYAEIGVESFFKECNEPKQDLIDDKALLIDDNFDYPLLADSVASMLASPSQCLQALAELNVHSRLKLCLDLAKTELDTLTRKKISISRAQTLVDEDLLKFRAETRRKNRDQGLDLVLEKSFLGNRWIDAYVPGGL